MKIIIFLILCFSISNCSTKKKEDNTSLLVGLLAINASTPANIDTSTISASSIVLNNTSVTSGNITSGTPLYYKVDLVSGKSSLFGVFSLSSSLDLQLTVYDSTGKYISTVNKNSTENLEQISVANTASGTHYFKVNSANSVSGSFSAQIFNSPVTGNGICKVSNYCIDNGPGSSFTSSNCGGSYYASTATRNTCAIYYTEIYSKNAAGKCTAFSNKGAQTLNFDPNTTASSSSCAQILKGEQYIYE